MKGDGHVAGCEWPEPSEVAELGAVAHGSACPSVVDLSRTGDA